MLHFWATWCKPCARELPALDHLYMRWRHQAVAFFALAIDDENETGVPAYVRAHGLQLPVLPLSVPHAPRNYWNWGVPASYLINPEGQLVGRALGERNWDSDAGDALIAALTSGLGAKEITGNSTAK